MWEGHAVVVGPFQLRPLLSGCARRAHVAIGHSVVGWRELQRLSL